MINKSMEDIKKIRLSEKNKIKVEIKTLTFLNKNNSDQINNYRRLDNNDFNINKISILKNQILERTNTIDSLKQKILDIDIGLLDTELKNNIIISTQKINNKYKETSNKKKLRKAEKEENKMKSKLYFKKTYKNDRENKFLNKNLSREFSYYLKKVDTIPDYMIKNLKQMPNNKGYIWRGIHCYGDLPSVNDNHTILFEKSRGVLRIHEWIRSEFQTKYIISEKQNKYKKNKIIHINIKKNIS